MISAKIIADSVSPEGFRITTMQLKYPRFVHSEFMTHRVFSRNAASSRAIPIEKMIEQVEKDPAMPVFWGKNQKGMQAREELEDFEPRKEYVQSFLDEHERIVYSPRHIAKEAWLRAAHDAVVNAKNLAGAGIHKQIVNRILEPWQWMETIVTATEWHNFYTLRRHADAQPEIKALADEMWEAMQKSTPKRLEYGQWHLPYVDDASIVFGGGLVTSLDELKKWSVARCARVSYLTHDKTDPLPEKDVMLHDQLLSSGHFSPFEHQATPKVESRFFANFRCWQSYRHQLGC